MRGAVHRVLTIDGVIDLLEPLHHGGDEKTGSTPVLRAIDQYDEETGETVRVPFLSGNAIRGVLRRLAFRDLLAAIGYDVQSKKLHHALFSGGALEKSTGGEEGEDLAFRRRLRDSVPPLALFGASVGNQMLPSCLRVGHGRLVCRENAFALPPSLRDDKRALKSCREFTDISFATRRDDLREEREEGEQATQMKIEFECLIAGSRLAHRFALEQADDLEASCLAHVTELWKEQPYIGAKSASGYGRVRLAYATQHTPELYRAYVGAERAAIGEALDELSRRCDGPTKRNRRAEGAS
jgi:hypothetical protein